MSTGKKILRVIETCNDCDYRKSFSYKNDNYTTAEICCFANDTDSKTLFPFILELNASKSSNILPIPHNCPLEDYKSKIS